MKLERLIMPITFGVLAGLVVMNANREEVKTTLDSIGNYLKAIPIGILMGYLGNKLGDFQNSFGYNSNSTGCPHP